MRSFIFKNMRKNGRARSRHDGKRDGIIDAGIRLLARKDFEAISMARLAREAGCSVGALYARFPDKNVYLYHLIAAAFRSMKNSAELELNSKRWKHLSATARVKLIVDHVVSKMTNPRGAGIIRATMKLATIRPLVMEQFEEYRSTVGDCAVAMLSGKTARTLSAGTVRVGMQVVFATITDAVLQKRPGPMTAGSNRMRSALTHIMLGYLGISKNSGWSGAESEGEDEPGDYDLNDDPPTSGEASVFDPDLRVFRRSKVPQATKPAKSKARPSLASTKSQNPVQALPKVPKTKDMTVPTPRLRRRHTVI